MLAAAQSAQSSIARDQPERSEWMRSPEVLLQCVEAEIGEFGAEELDHMLLSVCCPPPPPHPARVARSLGQVHEVYCGQVEGTRGSLSQPTSRGRGRWPCSSSAVVSKHSIFCRRQTARRTSITKGRISAQSGSWSFDACGGHFSSR